MENEGIESWSATLRSRVLIRVLAVAVIAIVGGMIGWSYASGGIFRVLVASGTAEEKVFALRAFFDGFGMAAPLAYVGLVILEVVIAPIPGTMLYAPGGVIFGGFWGGALSLLGNVIGAGIACQLMRLFIGRRGEGERSSAREWSSVESRGSRAREWSSDESLGARARLAE